MSGLIPRGGAAVDAAPAGGRSQRMGRHAAGLALQAGGEQECRESGLMGERSGGPVITRNYPQLLFQGFRVSV